MDNNTTLAVETASPNITQLQFPGPTQSDVIARPDAAISPDMQTVTDTVPTLQDIPTFPDTHTVPTGDVPTQARLQELPDVLEFCKVNNFPADLVGQWVWIKFPEKPDAETRELLKAAGFRWVKVRGQWAHNCGYHCRKGKGNPRWKYGCLPVSEISRDEIASLSSTFVI